MEAEWFTIKNIDDVDSPALVIYPERVKANIDLAISMVNGNTNRLRPHVKTNKTIEATVLMLQAGISKFKCATIAEAEMLAMAGATDILLAYQPTMPKVKRLISLIKKYNDAVFSCLADNTASAQMIAGEASRENVQLRVFLDVNVGMNRTGIFPGEGVIELYRFCNNLDGIIPVGLHAYDGHIRTKDINQRTLECDAAFSTIEVLQHTLIKQGFPEPLIVVGGSPTFPVHAKRKEVECSPGTFIFWDYGYQSAFKEQLFLPAALVITRVISQLPGGKFCLDLGHKSIAAENELPKRVYFLNAPRLLFVSQSEEHLVVETDASHPLQVGDVLYGLPYHICPTVALYERGITIENTVAKGEWKIIARDRKIYI